MKPWTIDGSAQKRYSILRIPMGSRYIRLTAHVKADLHIYRGPDMSVKHCNYLLWDILGVPSLCNSVSKYMHKQSTLLL